MIHKNMLFATTTLFARHRQQSYANFEGTLRVPLKVTEQVLALHYHGQAKASAHMLNQCDTEAKQKFRIPVNLTVWHLGLGFSSRNHADVIPIRTVFNHNLLKSDPQISSGAHLSPIRPSYIFQNAYLQLSLESSMFFSPLFHGSAQRASLWATSCPDISNELLDN